MTAYGLTDALYALAVALMHWKGTGRELHELAAGAAGEKAGTWVSDREGFLAHLAKDERLPQALRLKRVELWRSERDGLYRLVWVNRPNGLDPLVQAAAQSDDPELRALAEHVRSADRKAARSTIKAGSYREELACGLCFINENSDPSQLELGLDGFLLHTQCRPAWDAWKALTTTVQHPAPERVQ